MARTLALAACLILAAVIAWTNERTPRPKPADAPAAEFSARRAFADVRAIARVPHPAGSEANREVRDHVMRRMTGLGLSPQVQVAEAMRTFQRGGDTYVLGGMVENVVGVLPGQDPTLPAVLLMAHYDSVPASPGAADDAAGVAAGLEIVRALAAEGPLLRDVVLVATDSEEAGLLGAQAFFDAHPLARRVGFVINMEARGSAGRVSMFETGAGNAETIALFRASAVRPASDSLTVYAYEQMPNDTDFSVPKDRGIPGLNYAFIGRQFDYHSPTSTPQTLSLGSLQDLGQQGLAAARAAAYADTLPSATSDVVYANTLGGHILAYPPVAGWLPLLMAAGLIGLAAWRARKRGRFAWLDVAQGAGASLYLIAFTAASLRLARRATGVGESYFDVRELLAQSGRFELALILVGLGAGLYAAGALARGQSRAPAAALALGAGLGCQLFGGLDPVGLGLGLAAAALALVLFGRPAGQAGAWAGVLALLFAAAVALQITAAPAAFVLAWPLLLASAAAALTAFGDLRRSGATALALALVVIGLAFAARYVHALHVALGLPELLTLPAWIALALVWPLAHPKIGGAGRYTALGLIVVGFLAVLLLRLDAPWSDRYPRATYVVFAQDMETGRAQRVSPMAADDPWTRQVLTADGGEIEEVRVAGLFFGAARGATARPVALDAPQLTLTRQGARLTLRLAPPPDAAVARLDLKTETQVSEVRVQGRPVAGLLAPGEQGRLRWTAPPDAGLEVSFEAAGDGAIEATYAIITPGWPAEARPLPPRPARTMPFDWSDSTVTTGTRRLTWRAADVGVSPSP